VRATLLVVAYLVLFLVAFSLPPLVLAQLLDYAGLLPVQAAQRFDPAAPFQVLLYATGFLAVVGLTWLFCRWLDRRSPLELGLRLRGRWRRDLLVGFGVGTLLMSLIFVLELAGGWYRPAGFAWQHQSTAYILQALVVSFALFALAATLEELAFRGYVLQTLERGWGTPAALVATSIPFAVLHLFNPGAGPVSTLSLAVAGLLLASASVATRTLRLPCGLHLAWN